MAKRKQAKAAEGISYVCRYRLMHMLRKYFRRKRLMELDKKIAAACLKIYRGDFSPDDDEYHEWHEKYGMYKSWKKKLH